MALNWDVTQNVNAYREISREEYQMSERRGIMDRPRYEDADSGKYYEMTTECNMLIYLLGVTIGIPELNEDNWERVYNRIHLMEMSNGGTFLYRLNPKTQKAESYAFTKKMVWDNVGIKTNGSILTSKQFKSKLSDAMIGELEV